MARIRTIKPEFPQSETIGKLSRDARLLFIQLWTIADDWGRTRAAARMLASLLYPYDDDAPTLMNAWLFELEQKGCIRRYVINGDTYLDIPGWGRHQRIDNAGKSRIPEYVADTSPPLAEIRREPPRTAESLDTSPLDLGPRTLGPRIDSDARASGAEAPNPRKIIFDVGVPWLAKATDREPKAVRALVAKWCHARGDPAVASALVAAQQEAPVNAISWIEARLNENAQRKPSDLQRRRSLAHAFLDLPDGESSPGGDDRDKAAVG